MRWISLCLSFLISDSMTEILNVIRTTKAAVLGLRVLVIPRKDVQSAPKVTQHFNESKYDT